jgi:3-isopropylmalate dehydrogenase
MLLRWSLGQADAADAVERAVSAALDAGYRTADLWPRSAAAAEACTRVGTVEMADAVVNGIGTAAEPPGPDLGVPTTVATAQLLGLL